VNSNGSSLERELIPELKKKIEVLIRKYNEIKPKLSHAPHYFSEQDTATKFIKPMLEALGWDIFDPDKVREEVPFEGGHVDCVLYSNGTPHVIIEYKHLELSALTFKDDYRKRRERAKRFGVNYFVYTNFAETIIYDFKKGKQYYFEKPTDYFSKLNILKGYLLKKE